jgi:hypothetical protein
MDIAGRIFMGLIAVVGILGLVQEIDHGVIKGARGTSIVLVVCLSLGIFYCDDRLFHTSRFRREEALKAPR